MRDRGGKAPAGGAKARDAKKKKEKGGARSFVTSAEDLEHRNMLEEQKQTARKARRADDDDDEDDDEDDDSEEDSDDDANANVVAFERVPQKSLFGFSQSADGPAMEAKPKKKGVQGILKVENPNMKPAQNKVMKAKDMTGGVEQQLSRREREAIEKEAAAARYMKKHLAGETEEAKKDLARLQEVKRRREEAEQRKKEEEAAAAEREKGKKKVVEKNDEEPLDARAIKALKPNVLKDYLKDRGLSTQGQKKDLIQRLIDYENERAL
uniref:SAP domain-containing protein n=1 Tax=Globisporangium ultimum (strain ATCC 200006 / CBS 805.95 / DAOM BR144) TaxID=431595 RepID=K3X3H1_GLOUD